MTPHEDRGEIRVPSLWFLFPCVLAVAAAVLAACVAGDALVGVGLGLAGLMFGLAALVVVRLRRA